MEQLETPEIKQEVESNLEEVKETVEETAEAVVEPVVETVEPVEEVKADEKVVSEKEEAVLADEANAEDENDDDENADDAEEETVEGPKLKEQFKGKVVKVTLAAALVDIGYEKPTVIHIAQVLRPDGDNSPKNLSELLEVGQEIDVWVRRVREDRIELTMIKPFDLEWREIKKDMVVKGKVVRMEPFGVFLEIGAERPGLIHISEMAHHYVKQPSDILKIDDEVEAQVLEVNRRKKQIKLSIKALQPVPEEPERSSYGRNAEKLGDIDLASTGGTPVRRPLSARAQQLKDASFSSDGGERTTRRPKRSNKKRAELNTEGIDLMFSSTAEGEVEQTAMEIALREAMAKAKSRKKAEKKKSGISDAQADILARTLSNKAG